MDLSKKESVAMTRLRTGHSTMLRAYRHRIGLDDCRRRSTGRCNPPTDVVSGGALARHRVFGRSDPTLKEVFTDAGRVLEYLRQLGSLTPPPPHMVDKSSGRKTKKKHYVVSDVPLEVDLV